MQKQKNSLAAPFATKTFRIYAATVIAVAVLIFASGSALASGLTAQNPEVVINNLSDFIFKLIQSIGFLMLAFGIVTFGISLKSHDASARANSLLTVAGGLVVFLAKPILDLITGGM